MAVNPLLKKDRILQTKSQIGDVKSSITLFDVDSAIMSYLQDVALPTLDNNGQALKIPVIYGNSERWNGARRQGIYRDSKGKIQLPLMMIRRTTVSKNDAIMMPNRLLSYAGVTKYSPSNRYDKFSILNNTQPKYETYNITMPDYVEINYDCMGWTNFTEQLNTVIESMTFASDEYWGDKNKFKFITYVTDFDVQNEVGEGTERINRVEFSLNVKAYLLPEKFDGQDTTKKSFNIRKVAFATEVDMTSGTNRLEGLLTTPSPYYDNKDSIDYLSINNSNSGFPVVDNTITFQNIKVIPTPSQLANVVSSGLLFPDGNTYNMQVWINGVRVAQSGNFTLTYVNNQLTINFTMGYPVTAGTAYDITITGKFVNL